jgi:hypothetical protein
MVRPKLRASRKETEKDEHPETVSDYHRCGARRKAFFSGALFDVKYLNNITTAPSIKAAAVCGLFHIRLSLRCRLLALLRHADFIERCPFSKVLRKTFAQAEFFRF